MKTLEIKNRKNTTKFAKEKVIELIKSINLPDCSDLTTVRSLTFSCSCVPTSNCSVDILYFDVDDNNCIVCVYRNLCDKDQMVSVEAAFDDDCTFINFNELLVSLESLINNINKKIDLKETEINNFLSFVDSYKNSK